MGYTHYLHPQRHATQDEWNAIKDSWLLLYHLGLFPKLHEPRVDDDIIHFNGVGNDGHETMILEREGLGFDFCKTARKPYDLAVVALLLIAHHHAPDAWEIKSDGGPDDWAEGLALVQKYVHPSITLPPAILEE